MTPGGGNGNSLQYSCLGNLHRGAGWATVHGVQSVTTERLNVHTCREESRVDVLSQLIELGILPGDQEWGSKGDELFWVKAVP